MIHLFLEEREEFSLLFLEPSGNKPHPTDLRTLEYPEINGTKGLIISCQVSQSWVGWVVAAAVSHYRNRSQWAAAYDPKLNGAIVYASLGGKYVVGDVLPVQFKDLTTGEWVRKGASVPYKKGNRAKAPHQQ